jgi:hypothetical protein
MGKGAAVCYVDHTKLIICGGRTSVVGEFLDRSTNQAYSIDVVNEQIVRLPDMLDARTEHGIAKIDDSLYVFGCLSGPSSKAEKYRLV